MSGIRPGDRVTLHYRLACGGQQIVSTFDAAPETFSVGAGDIDLRLEWLLHGLESGAHETWQLDADQAFGMHNPDMIKSLPRCEFPPGMEPLPEHRVDFPLPNGQTLTATIVEVEADSVTLDFNHPLAGLPVEFEVRILAVEQGSTA
jgi:FKBP-type peptidyl-prolyl cis-trans isomerase SlpA